MTDTAAIDQLSRTVDNLAAAFTKLANLMGARLTRAELCERLGVHRNTLKAWERDGKIPTPGADGRWLLSEIVEWETKR